MSDYPPKLVSIEPSSFGSVLTLSDSRTIPIDIRPDQLNRALAKNERPSVDEFVAMRSLNVYADVWGMLERDWDRISEIILASVVTFDKLRDFPRVWSVFGQRAVVVRELPQRVYGGLDQALYTGHAFKFREDTRRPAPWQRGLLNAPGGWVFETWVHLGSAEIEITAEVLSGHFVE